MDINTKQSSVNYTDNIQQENPENSVDTGNNKTVVTPAVPQQTKALVAMVTDKAVTGKGGYTSGKPKLAPHKKNPLQGKNTEHSTKTKPQTILSFFEIIAGVQDYLLFSQKDSFENRTILNNKRNHSFMTEEQFSAMDNNVMKSAETISRYVDKLSDYYYAIFNSPNYDDKNSLNEFDDELKNKLAKSTKEEIKEFINKKIDMDAVKKNINDTALNYSERTSIFSSALNILNELPLNDDENGCTLKNILDNLKSELYFLHSQTKLYDTTTDYYKLIAEIDLKKKSEGIYENELAVIMGKLSDLQEKLTQCKMEAEVRLQHVQQLALQTKTEHDAAEIEKKIKEAEIILAVVKAVAIAVTVAAVLLAIFTAGSSLALAAAAIAAVVAATIIVADLILEAMGQTTIMSVLMKPLMKLVEVIQKFIKDTVMARAKAEGLSEEKLRELDEKMDAISMAVAMVIMFVLIVVLSSIIGKLVGKMVSEMVKQIITEIIKEIQRTMMIVSIINALSNGISTIIQAKINEEISRRIADIELDQQVIESLTETMNRLMNTFTENQQELRTLNEKTSAMARDNFRNWKAILNTPV